MNRDDILRMAREAGDVRRDCCLPEESFARAIEAKLKEKNHG